MTGVNNVKALFELSPTVNGSGPLLFSWQRTAGNYISMSGSSYFVTIANRSGAIVSQMALQGVCTSMDWDKDGDVLSVTEERSSIVYLWNAHSKEVLQLDTGVKDVACFAVWAKKSQILAIGTAKGSLMLYNHRVRKKSLIIGKHSKKITCGCWNNENLLALGSEDRTISINNLVGDTLQQVTLRCDPSNLQFAECCHDTDKNREVRVSAVLGGKTLFLLDVDEDHGPVELAFQSRYGSIVAYEWYEGDKIMIGFSNGFFVCVSSIKDKMGQELFQARNHKDFLTDVAVSVAVNQGASCGDNAIKIHNLDELKEVYNILSVEEEKGVVNKLGWTSDGQLLSVSTNQGYLLTFLTKLPLLGAAFSTKLAYMNTLQQVTVVNCLEEEAPFRKSLPIEPTFVALGPYHVAVGLNNKAWIYSLGDGNACIDKSYLGTISSFCLNGDYAAALFEGKVLLHLIEPGLIEVEGKDERLEKKMFPDPGNDERFTSIALARDFLILGTENGTLRYFYLEDWEVVNEFHHLVGISMISPDSMGTKVAFIDEKGDGFLYNPITDVCSELTSFPRAVLSILWETFLSDKHVLIVCSEERLHTYVYCQDTLDGSVCQYAGATKLPYGQKPLLMYNGEVSCQTLTGKISVQRLTTHSYQDEQDLNEQELKVSFEKCIILKRFKDAWSLAIAIDNTECWRHLNKVALYHMDVDLAIRCSRQIHDIAQVSALEKAKHMEDKNALAGYIMLMNGEYDKAQDLFIKSFSPLEALHMRMDLKHWDQALQLARTLAPEELCQISLSYAQQLEQEGDYLTALKLYEEVQMDAFLSQYCQAGIARTAIMSGDVRRGISVAQQSNMRSLKKECADILESMKLYTEAGTLYKQANYPDQAVAMFIKTKNWEMVGQLLPLVSTLRYHSLFAKAKEADGHFNEAAIAYKAAKDYDNYVRILIQHLHQIEEAVKIVRETQSAEGAKMVAKYYQSLGDPTLALQFLVVSRCNQEAFELAKNESLMDTYTSVIESDATWEDLVAIAQYYNDTGNPLEAGRFYIKAKEYAKAVNILTSGYQWDSEEGKHIDLAIEAIGEAQTEELTQKLLSYLMGEEDGKPKAAKYIFQYHMAIKQYREAARTAIIVAREHQNAGNYKLAHDVLFNMYQELKKLDIKIPAEMDQSLMLLHSYMLVKPHVKKGDHGRAARLLLRVANNISRFPSHVVPILTSTVIECQRSGMKSSAFNFAAALMKPDLRSKIDQKWKKKIEQIVRKPDRTEEEELLDPCPFCNHPIVQSQLDCQECKNAIPYCIASGKHMVRNDWSKCPKCQLPALFSEFKSLLEVNPVCPMCHEEVMVTDIAREEEDLESSELCY